MRNAFGPLCAPLTGLADALQAPEAARSATQYLATSLRPRPDTVLSGIAVHLLPSSLLRFCLGFRTTVFRRRRRYICGKTRAIAG